MSPGRPAGAVAGPELKVFRSTGARVAAWAWFVFAAINLADVLIRGRDLSGAIAAVVLLLGCGVAYVIGLRPAVVAGEDGILLRNPLRNTVVPWRAVRRIVAGETLRVECGAEGEEPRTVRAWTMQTSPRARAKAERRSAGNPGDALAEHLKGRTPADYVAEQLTEITAARRRAASGATAPRDTGTGPMVTWSVPAVAALAVPGVLLAVLALVAALT